MLLNSGGSLVARNTDIDGSIQAEMADFADIVGTFVNGNIQLDALVGDLSVVDASTVGGNNRVSGNQEDQCANLQPELVPGAPSDLSHGGVTVPAPGATARASSGGGGAVDPFALLLAAGMLLGRAIFRRKA